MGFLSFLKKHKEPKPESSEAISEGLPIPPPEFKGLDKKQVEQVEEKEELAEPLAEASHPKKVKITKQPPVHPTTYPVQKKPAFTKISLPPKMYETQKEHPVSHVVKPAKQMPKFRKEVIHPKPVIEPHITSIPKKSKYMQTSIYKELIKQSSDAASLIKETNLFYDNLNELKDIQDKTFAKSQESIEDIQRKIVFIDKILFEKNMG